MYEPRRKPLFSEQDGQATLRALVQQAEAEVDSLSEEQIRSTDPDALVQYFVDKYHADVPTLDLDNVAASDHEQDIEVEDPFGRGRMRVKGSAFEFEIPFSGNGAIFRMRPNSYDYGPPYAEIRGQSVCFSIVDRELTQDRIRREFETIRDSIQKYLAWHREIWQTLDGQIATAVRTRIEQRRVRLQKQNTLAGGLATLGIKLKEKASDPKTYVAPAIRQRIRPTLPPMKVATPPDPTLDQAQYESILALLRGAGRSIEQSSSRTRSLDEETLRDMLLVPLNAHFGQATGEAFNFSGKTDILIRHEGGNIFVTECKIWNGDKHFLATIDQLLGYLTWRDTKSALIIFNRNVGFSDVVAKLRTLPTQHTSFVAGPVRLDDTSFGFTLKLPRDPNRHITVSILGFDLGAS